MINVKISNLFSFMKNKKINVSFVYNDERWKKDSCNLENLASNAVSKVYKVLKIQCLHSVDVDIVLSNDNELRRLNKDYRGKDCPTNVLSFETGDDVMIGDIIISFERVEVEADELGLSFEDHFVHLVIHGMLHLLGLDHIEDEDASEMEFYEVLILKEFGIENPYR